MPLWRLHRFAGSTERKNGFIIRDRLLEVSWQQFDRLTDTFSSYTVWSFSYAMLWFSKLRISMITLYDVGVLSLKWLVWPLPPEGFELPFCCKSPPPRMRVVTTVWCRRIQMRSNKEMSKPSACRRKDEHVQIRYDTSGVEIRQCGLGWG